MADPNLPARPPLGEDIYRLTVESLTDYALFLIDAEGRVLTWNAGAQSLLGYTASEAIGSDFRRFFTPEDVADGLPDREIQLVLTTGRSRDENWLVRKDDSLFWADGFSNAVRDGSGQILCLAKVVRDATERRQAAEENARRTRQMSEFIGLIAHDVRQPLSVARGQVQRLRRLLQRGEYDRASGPAEAVEIATFRLDSMIQELVDSAQLETQQVRLRPAALDLTGFTHDLLHRLAGVLDVERVHIESIDPVRVYADPDRLERIIGNLVSNALKYSEPSTDVTINTEQGGAMAYLTVADRGMGIAADETELIFDREYRTARASGAAGGLGLGLYITRLLVEAHGGRVWVESEPGRGSAFHVALPAGPAESAG